jgi:hypothetical protein
MDTTRADAMRAYGGKFKSVKRRKSAAPLTKFGVGSGGGPGVFDEDWILEFGLHRVRRALTPIPMTRPSLTSIHTGRSPGQHGVLGNAMALPADSITLAKELKERGYRTGGFTGVSLIDHTSGLFQGMDLAIAPKKSQRNASWVFGNAREWLANVGDEDADNPVFLWIHLFDAHESYDPPMSWRGDVDPIQEEKYPRLHWGDYMDYAKRHGGNIDGPLLEHAKSMYAAGVVALEYDVTEFLRTLRELWGERGFANSMIIVVADHGECFENGSYFEHSDCQGQAALRVPLLVKLPDHASASASTDVAEISHEAQKATGASSGSPRNSMTSMISKPTKRDVESGWVSITDIFDSILTVADADIGQGVALLQPSASRAFHIRYPEFTSKGLQLYSGRKSVVRTAMGDTLLPTRGDGGRAALVIGGYKILLDEGEGENAGETKSSSNILKNARGNARESDGQNIKDERTAKMTWHLVDVSDPGLDGKVSATEISAKMKSLMQLKLLALKAKPETELQESEDEKLQDALRQLGYIE